MKQRQLEIGQSVWLHSVLVKCDLCSRLYQPPLPNCPACRGSGKIPLCGPHQGIVRKLSWNFRDVWLRGDIEPVEAQALYATAGAARARRQTIEWVWPPFESGWALLKVPEILPCPACEGKGRMHSTLLRRTFKCPHCRGEKNIVGYRGRVAVSKDPRQSFFRASIGSGVVANLRIGPEHDVETRLYPTREAALAAAAALNAPFDQIDRNNTRGKK